jgi:hypothetical protein
MHLAAKVNCGWLAWCDAQPLGSLSDNERQQVSHVILADGVHKGLTPALNAAPTDA